MTPFENIYDLALMSIQDYKLDILAKEDMNTFLTHMRGILVSSLDMFGGICRKSLDFEKNEDNEWEFLSDLNLKEQIILANSMVLKWFTRTTNDITQINLKLQGRDKKTHQESTNLKEKSEYLDRLREKLYQDIVDYQLQDDGFDIIFGA